MGMEIRVQTTFRKTMLRELELIIDESVRSKWQQENPGVDLQTELISSFVDYYTPELVGWPSFREEFSPAEIAALVAFVDSLEGLSASSWQTVVEGAQALRDQLGEV
jgi:hypothetical protein